MAMDKDSEKMGVEHVPSHQDGTSGVLGGGGGGGGGSGSSEKGSATGGPDYEALHYFTPEEERRIVRRVDRRLVTTLGFLYCVSLMDRTNLGAANIAGMARELMLVGDRYSIVSLVFFCTYIVFQPPSTVIVRWVGPRIHLAAITIFWGALMIGMGFVNVWTQLTALRVILGILEAGFFPSCVYLLSTWYTRYEVGKRYSFFYLLGCVAAAFAGILAYGLMQMDGLANLTGWRWIFIMEGLITCLLGIAGYWLIVDFPDSKRASWRFLGERERAFIVARVMKDRGDAHLPAFSLKKFFGAGTDVRIWCYGMIFFNTTTITYALAYFLPIILNQSLGFTVGESQCLVAPPYALAGIVMFSTAWVGDKYRIRGPIVVFNMILCLIGIPIMGWHKSAAVRYFGVFLVTAGANSNVPAVMSYQANNIRGQWKRAFCSATLVGLGGFGGIAGSLVFRGQDNPTYYPGLYACITCALLNIVLVCGLSVSFYFAHRRAAEGAILEEDDDNKTEFHYTY